MHAAKAPVVLDSAIASAAITANPAAAAHTSYAPPSSVAAPAHHDRAHAPWGRTKTSRGRANSSCTRQKPRSCSIRHLERHLQRPPAAVLGGPWAGHRAASQFRIHQCYVTLVTCEAAAPQRSRTARALCCAPRGALPQTQFPPARAPAATRRGGEPRHTAQHCTRGGNSRPTARCRCVTRRVEDTRSFAVPSPARLLVPLGQRCAARRPPGCEKSRAARTHLLVLLAHPIAVPPEARAVARRAAVLTKAKRRVGMCRAFLFVDDCQSPSSGPASSAPRIEGWAQNSAVRFRATGLPWH